MNKYKERREKAAEFFNKLKPERFSLENYKCGTQACAIGWMAKKKFDGWHWLPECMVPISPDGIPGMGGASFYFGLTFEDTVACFGCQSETRNYYLKPITEVTPADVTCALLSLPYVG